MANFFLTKKAVQDLEDIWDYTVETWSEKQAETYYELIIDSCQRLVEEPMHGKFYEIIDKNILGYKTGEHIIFYKIVSNDIEIVRILHRMMDLKLRL